MAIKLEGGQDTGAENYLGYIIKGDITTIVDPDKDVPKLEITYEELVEDSKNVTSSRVS